MRKRGVSENSEVLVLSFGRFCRDSNPRPLIFAPLQKILSVFVKAPTMNECEEARGLRSVAFQKDSNYSKNLLERSV